MRSGMLASAGMAFLMAASAVGAWFATPTRRVADTRPQWNIDQLIPARFAGWQVDGSIVPVQVDPGVQKSLDKIYAQSLARTYVNARGERVMLVIAYGSEQNDTLAVHKPDVCYPAQGFEIIRQQNAVLDTGYGKVPVTQLVARQPRRYEPVTYWIRVGDAVDGTGMQRKMTQLKYGLTGLIPDGLLFRVSSLGPDEEAFALQREFARAMLASLGPAGREFVLGSSIGPLAASTVAPSGPVR